MKRNDLVYGVVHGAGLLADIASPDSGGPFPVILQEGGGYFGDWQGNATIYANEAMATTAVLLPQVLELLG